MNTSPADQIIRLMNGMTVVSRCVMMAAHTVVWLATSHPFCRRALDCRGNQHAEDAFHILRGGKHDFDSTVLLRTLMDTLVSK